MDIFLCLAFESDGPVITKLYDKRREPEFSSRLQAIRLQHMSTCLSAACKWNIFDSSFVAISRIISDRDTFIDEVARLVKDFYRLAFPMQTLMQRLRRRVLSATVLYGVARGTQPPSATRPRPRGMYTSISERVDRLRAVDDVGS